jgi:hypothetical protein
VRGSVLERGQIAGIAAALHQLAVHVNDALRPSRLVQVVDVLRAEKEALPDRALERREGPVGGVWMADGRLGAPLRVEAPYDLGVRLPSVGRCNLFEPILLPEAPGVTKGADPALGADAGAGEDEDVRRARDTQGRKVTEVGDPGHLGRDRRVRRGEPARKEARSSSAPARMFASTRTPASP